MYDTVTCLKIFKMGKEKLLDYFSIFAEIVRPPDRKCQTPVGYIGSLGNCQTSPKSKKDRIFKTQV